MGYLNEAEKYLLAGNKLSIKADLRAYKFLSSLYLGELYMMWEDYTNAQIYFSDSINLEGEGCFGESAINIACIRYFSVNNRENMKESDLHRLENYILTNNYMRYDGIIRNRFAITLENFGDKYFIEAAKWFEKAIDVDKNNGLKFELGFDYLSYGNYFKRKGDVTSAKKMMGNALKIFKECGAKGWINLVDTNLASI
jgi:tetratricopeptide (TPR) repeat protein